jgi:hypothetical protein
MNAPNVKHYSPELIAAVHRMARHGGSLDDQILISDERQWLNAAKTVSENDSDICMRILRTDYEQQAARVKYLENAMDEAEKKIALAHESHMTSKRNYSGYFVEARKIITDAILSRAATSQEAGK